MSLAQKRHQGTTHTVFQGCTKSALFINCLYEAGPFARTNGVTLNPIKPLCVTNVLRSLEITYAIIPIPLLSQD